MDPDLARYLAELQVSWVSSGLDIAQVARRRAEVLGEIAQHVQALEQRGITDDAVRKAIAWHRQHRPALPFNLRLALANLPGLPAPAGTPLPQTRGTLSLRDPLETLFDFAFPVGRPVLRAMAAQQSAQRPVADPDVEGMLLAGAAANDFILGVVEGVESRARAVDAIELRRKIEAAFDDDHLGVGVVVGVAWGGAEDVRETLRIVRWGVGLLRPDARRKLIQTIEDQRQLVRAFGLALRQESIRPLAYQAGAAIGASLAQKLEEAFLSPPPAWLAQPLREFWPAIGFGRLISPIFWSMVSVMFPEVSVGGAMWRLLGPSVRRFARRVVQLLPDADSLERLAWELRPAPAHGRPNGPRRARPNAPSPRESATATGPLAGGLHAPARAPSGSATANRRVRAGSDSVATDRVAGHRERGLVGQDTAGPERPNPEASGASPNTASDPSGSVPRRHPVLGEHESDGSSGGGPGGANSPEPDLAGFAERYRAKLSPDPQSQRGLAEMFRGLRGHSPTPYRAERDILIAYLEDRTVLRVAVNPQSRTRGVVGHDLWVTYLDGSVIRVEITCLTATTEAVTRSAIWRKLWDKMTRRQLYERGVAVEGVIVLFIEHPPEALPALVEDAIGEIRATLRSRRHSRDRFQEVKRIEVRGAARATIAYRRVRTEEYFRRDS